MPQFEHVAAVTGASGGIGRAIALRLAAEGAAVAVAARGEDGGRETVAQIEDEGGTAFFTSLDVTEAEQVQAWVRDTAERFGRLDWLVNNAGMNGRSARIEEYAIAEFEQVVATNLLSAFYAVHAAIPIMRAQGGGAIVSIGSTASLQGYGMLGGYTASKHGLLGLTRSIALENADVPIRANCVCPGPVDTPLMRGIEELVSPTDPTVARAMFEGTTALKRYGTVEEIADVVHFLLGDSSRYVTGAAISVDGGVTTGV
ncbi:SDR family NAD(P)-dependent oxidoreductase [Conexibacter sp. CPCC 206217]|uniref:SDR family NAD(P)-dependent oxidoreductase n=1 Tax=Conexibacter sp. CPCC 206217 TaxID=3064574 RepID=UPI00271FB538|nr:SDR family NAD(P)-dependent oxidoreductase [Conexibacter sp. CPCC 206217]MDO8212433.1 SDR family NAD(P)-dependent oxidoreductase [Conexibacter sp. CPCC 206217]